MTSNAEGRLIGNTQNRIPELDGLRGTAILLVVVMHYFYFYPAQNHHPHGLLPRLYVMFERCIAIGWSGVDLFFVLSGFLIGGILLDAKSSTSYFKVFYLRRFFRIIPIYYLWIGIYILIAAVLVTLGRPLALLGEPKKWFEIASQFVFLQNFGFIQYSGLGEAWLLATWSLAVEEQFYLLAPFIVRSFSSRVLFRLLIFVLILAPILRLLFHYLPFHSLSIDPGYALMPCRADSLAMGMLVAMLWRNQPARRWLEANSAVLYGMFALFLFGGLFLNFYSPSHDALFTQLFGFSWLAVFFSLTLILALLKPAGPIASLARMRWLREFGRISYCLYLIHLAVNHLCYSLLLGDSHRTSDWRVLAIPVLAIGVSFLIAHLSWIFIEYPLQQRGHVFKYQFPSSS